MEQLGGDPELPSEDGGPSRAVVAVAVVAVVVVLGLGAWLLTRGDEDDGVLAPDTSEETETPRSTERRPTSSPPTTLATETSTTPPTTTLPPTSPPPIGPPDTALPASIAPGVTIPVSPTTGPPVDTAPPSSGPVPTADTTVPATTGPATTIDPPPASTPEDEPPTSTPDEAAVGDLVPNLAAAAEYVGDADQLGTLIDELLAAPRHDVASASPVSTLCATVALVEPMVLGGMWELDGRPLRSTDAREVRPPGFGECVETNGDPLTDGVYQFVAVDPSDTTSAAGTFVAGAERIEQRFRNNGDVDVCTVLIAPAEANYYESFDVGSDPIEPGDTFVIPVADVRQDVRPLDCDDTALGELSFDPSGDEQDLAP